MSYYKAIATGESPFRHYVALMSNKIEGCSLIITDQTLDFQLRTFSGQYKVLIVSSTDIVCHIAFVKR